MSEPGRGQRLAQRVEREQAAARGAVMAGAEGERGLDLDADPVGRHAPAIMRAVHDEAAGGDRLEPGDAFAHPILRRDAREAQRPAQPRARPPPRPARAPHLHPARCGNGWRSASARRRCPQGSPRRCPPHCRHRGHRRSAGRFVHRFRGAPPGWRQERSSLVRRMDSDLCPQFTVARAAGQRRFWTTDPDTQRRAPAFHRLSTIAAQAFPRKLTASSCRPHHGRPRLPLGGVLKGRGWPGRARP